MTFLLGSREICVSFTAINDTILEDNELFLFTLQTESLPNVHADTSIMEVEISDNNRKLILILVYSKFLLH